MLAVTGLPDGSHLHNPSRARARCAARPMQRQYPPGQGQAVRLRDVDILLGEQLAPRNTPLMLETREQSFRSSAASLLLRPYGACWAFLPTLLFKATM
jgi:hypothetical protein